MSGTNFRALCAELLAALKNAIRVIYNEDGTQHISTADDVITRADAALAAEPAPAPEGGAIAERPLAPSRVLIEQVSADLWQKHCIAGRVDASRGEFDEIVKDFCDCFFTHGVHTPAPVPVAERLPGAGDCDADGRCWWFDTGIWLDLDDTDQRWRLCVGPKGWRWWLPYWALQLPSSQPEQA